MIYWDPSLLYAVLGSKRVDGIADDVLQTISNTEDFEEPKVSEVKIPQEAYPSQLHQFEAFQHLGGTLFEFDPDTWDRFRDGLQRARFLSDKCPWRPNAYQKKGLRLYSVGSTPPLRVGEIESVAVSVFFGSHESLLLYSKNPDYALKLVETAGMSALMNQLEELELGSEEGLTNPLDKENVSEDVLRQFIQDEGGVTFCDFPQPVQKKEADASINELIQQWHRIFGQR